jgi:GNAT superfamily N-acetyltransferase
MEWQRDGYRVTTDRARVDLAVVHGYLTRSYWCEGIKLDTVRQSVENSIPFSLLEGERQIGYARVITDSATIAYLGDVFVLPEYQGRGLGLWMIECVMAHPDLHAMRRWILLTRDAHSLYERVGFTPIAKPDRWMEKHDPGVYERGER